MPTGRCRVRRGLAPEQLVPHLTHDEDVSVQTAVGPGLVAGAEFRTAMASLPTGICVLLTEVTGTDRLWGSIVGSVVSASMSPPMVVVLLGRGGRAAQLVRRNRTFTLSVLGQAQRAVSDSMAGPRAALGPGDERLVECPGGWAVRGAAAHLTCLVDGLLRVGDHDLVTAIVTHVSSDVDVPGLVRHRSGYAGLHPGML